MNNFFQMVNVQAILFIYILVGFYSKKALILDDVTQQRLTEWVVRITFPCMVFASFHMEFRLEYLVEGATVIAIATGMASAALILGKFLYRRFPQHERCILQYGTLVSNAGFAGLPMIAGAYGTEGLFLASLFIIPTRILMWSAGISLFTSMDASARLKKVLLNPSLIAVVLGLIRMVLQIPLPDFMNTAIQNLGASTTPLAMALVGAMLADISPRAMLDPKAFYLAFVRQLLLPLLCLISLRALGVNPLTTAVSVVLTGMPIGSTTAILAGKYGADATFASKCVFLSTLTSLITVPLLTLFL